jgi:hypothetical protein
MRPLLVELRVLSAEVGYASLPEFAPAPRQKHKQTFNDLYDFLEAHQRYRIGIFTALSLRPAKA